MVGLRPTHKLSSLRGNMGEMGAYLREIGLLS
jgi:hypothetical protein